MVATYERVVQHREQEPIDLVYFDAVLSSIEATLRYAGELYDKLAYAGLVMCEVNLTTIENTALIYKNQRPSDLPRNLQGYFAWEVEPTVRELNDSAARTEVLYRVISEFVRSSGYIGDSNQLVDSKLAESGLYPKPS